MSRLEDSEAAFRNSLRGQWGHPLEFHEELTSTQDRLRELAETDAPAGTCVITDHQVTGRGQHGRRWEARPGQGLLFSLLLRPALPAAELAGLPSLIASLALLRSLALLELDLSLRWPNDLMAGPRKLAGILMEGRIEGEHYRYLALGIGLNLGQARVDFPPDLAETAASLRQLLGQAPIAEDILAGFLIEMENLWTRLEKGEGQALIEMWKEHWGDSMHIVRTRNGPLHAMDIDEQGGLVLGTIGGVEEILYDSQSILNWEDF